VCSRIQLLLVTCVFYLFPYFLVTLVSAPLLIHPPHRAHIRRAAASRSPPSLFPGAVGQKRKEKKRKKEISQKKEKKNPKKRETAAQSKWVTGTDSSW
jgi:hypothetical protein